MSDQKYNEVFEFIKSSLVPKNQFDESQSEILVLKSALENATNDLKKMKSDYDEQRLNIDIIQAEKESLAAEKKTLEVKFNEISLKLKKKTNQYDSLLKSQQQRTQTIKEEPKEIGIVNIPSSSSSSSQKSEPVAKTGAKRTRSPKDDAQRTKAKRKKTAKPDSTSQTAIKSTQIFSCCMYLYSWGMYTKKMEMQ